MAKKATIWGVHDDDLEGLLRSVGLLGRLLSGRLRCAFCSSVISMENLHSIFPHGGVIKVSCSDAQCVKELMLNRHIGSE